MLIRSLTIGRFASILPIPEKYDAAAEDAYPGALFSVDVSMQSAETTILGYQFDLHLPPGISLYEEHDGSGYACQLSSRHLTGEAQVQIEQTGGNTYHVNAKWDDAASFRGQDGCVMKLTCQVSESVSPETYPASIDGGSLFFSDLSSAGLDGASFAISVGEGLMGDVNLDGKVNVSDIMCVVNYILGEEPVHFVRPLADLNADRKITVSDIMGIVNIILR